MKRKTDVVIVGAGLAGLTCAIKCKDLGREFLLLEKSQRIGGRVGSIKEDGYIFDLGFQVYNTAYHYANSIIDGDLDLKSFSPGAAIYNEDAFEIISDPMRDLKRVFQTIFSNVASFNDKLRILKLKLLLQRYSIEKDFSNDVSTLKYLKNFGFSEKIIHNFFTPFFSGIFLEKELETSSKFFKYVFSKLNKGLATLPSEGMQALPDLICSKLDPQSILLKQKVKKISSDQTIILDSGEKISGKKIILTGNSVNILSPQSIVYNSIKTIYFSSKVEPKNGRYIHLFPNDDVINNIAILTMISNHYSQNSDHLFSVSIFSDYKSESEDITYVQNKLPEFYGGVPSDYKFLKYMNIKKATIKQRPNHFNNQHFIEGGIILAGDQTTNGSIDGAVFSGIRAVECINEK
tara:strand:+ start:597 stop:1811 length:1215 start_codon:yes stop_codon:yes gene_type:complete